MSETINKKKKVIVDRAQRPFVLIDVELITALTPFEFITYAQIKRRAGGDGECWESQEHMASETGIGVTSLKQVIRGLLEKNLLAKECRAGFTTIYTLTSPSEWNLPKQIIQLPSGLKLGLSKKSLTEPSRHATTEPSRVATTEPSRVATTNKIPFNIDPELDLITNSLTLTADAEFGEPDKSANAESFNFSEPEASLQAISLELPTIPLESPLNSLDEGLHQPTREDGKQTILEGNQTTGHSPLESNPTLNQEIDSAAPRSTNADRTQSTAHKPAPWGNGYDRQQSNRDRAQSSVWFATGIKNKRWKDRPDFDKFVSYVEIYAENRRQDPALNPDGTKFGKDYITFILSHTAATQDENDSKLQCWKTWNQEPPSPNYIEPKPIVEVVSQEPGTTGNTGYPHIDKFTSISDKARSMLVEMHLKRLARAAEDDSQRKAGRRLRESQRI